MNTLKSELSSKFTVTLNTFDENNVKKISGAEITTKFDNILNQIDGVEQSTGMDTKLVDFQITTINSNSVEMEIEIIIGTPTGPAAAWPSGNLDLTTSAQVLEDSINNYLTNYNLVNFGSSFIQNVNIVQWNDAAYPTPFPARGGDYNCNDCLFYTSHTYSVSNDLPSIHLDYFFNKGVTLVNKMRNQLRPYTSNSVTVSCEYGTDFLPCGGCDAFHTIEKVYIGSAVAL